MRAIGGRTGRYVAPDARLAGRAVRDRDTGTAKRGVGRAASETEADAPVVALGVRDPLYFSNDQPGLSKGLHACLFNNAWGTNYIMWYGEDACARFVVRA